jgi:hypothetical protein
LLFYPSLLPFTWFIFDVLFVVLLIRCEQIY